MLNGRVTNLDQSIKTQQTRNNEGGFHVVITPAIAAVALTAMNNAERDLSSFWSVW